MKFTFKHGVHPPSKKTTKNFEINSFNMPKKVYIPLTQHIGQPTELIVENGQRVLRGSLIGIAKADFCSNIYSSVSGKVLGSEYRMTSAGSSVMHVVIENDELYETISLPQMADESAESIRLRIKEAGIVGLGGATFPAHIKFLPNKPIDTLIINGAECEPYITCDHRLILEKTKEIIEGVRLIKKTLGVANAYIAIENNKQDAIEKLKELCCTDIQIVALKTKYPQGAEKQIIYAVTKRKVPCGKLPMDVGCVVSNIATAYHTYEAVRLNKPLYERVVTLAGDAIEKKGNYLIGNGVCFNDIYDFAKGEVAEDACEKIISGGPMMGFAQPNLKSSTTKGVSALLFLTKNELHKNSPTQCINCSKCASVCPMNLMPMFIESCLEVGELDNTIKYGVRNCIECGCCSYICPAGRPLVQSIRLAKLELQKRQVKK